MHAFIAYNNNNSNKYYYILYISTACFNTYSILFIIIIITVVGIIVIVTLFFLKNCERCFRACTAHCLFICNIYSVIHSFSSTTKLASAFLNLDFLVGKSCLMFSVI